ncbi:hypothetical protein NDU88_005097 [Pleurodeles waltl]|uniref:Uncharacterized protein n=1 Tax=Pleurodeles waltl TaxID=8319 RepID=A0AAV7VKS2_PLEWA|nr:hypothetical protein NDU88_005097 [Pleurodeles waltl]
MSAPPLFIRSSPAVRRLRLLELPSFEPCHSASTSTRAPSRPQVRWGLWLQVLPSQAALPHAIPLSLVADEHFSGALLRSRHRPPRSGAGPLPPLVAIGGRRSLRSVKRGWSSSVLLVHSGAGVASVPLALYVRASSVQSSESCHSASTFTRAPGRPQVRQGFWPLGPRPLGPPSQAAIPHATPLSLAVDQHFSGASFTLAGLRFCGYLQGPVGAHGLRVRHLGFPSHAPPALYQC